MSSQTGHPKGLYLLFFTEMWERFSYYGMRAILVLFLTKQLMMDKAFSSELYGSFTGLVYLTPIIGGYMADRYWGNRKSIILGGLLMAAGQFALFFSGASSSSLIMYIGLGLLVFGNGFFKPNISTLVVRGATEEFNIERTNASRSCFTGGKSEPVKELGALDDAHAEVIEGGVVINVFGLGDQAVVSNHEYASFLRLGKHIGEGGAVDRGDHEHICALGDHVFDLGDLVGDIVISKLQIGIVSQVLEGLDHAFAIGNPASGGLGGHGNANEFLLAARGVATRGIAAGSCAATTSSKDHADEHQYCQNFKKHFLGHIFSLILLITDLAFRMAGNF